MLPLTTETAGLLDTRALARLPRGAALINVGRGGVLVTADLLASLDSGHLAAATLDVTEPEPLPTDSPLWTHPAVTITPHIASLVQSRISAGIVAENIRRLERGEPLLNPVDRGAGY
jgi:glyoxylate/hydroxypyruvate reductase A